MTVFEGVALLRAGGLWDQEANLMGVGSPLYAEDYTPIRSLDVMCPHPGDGQHRFNYRLSSFSRLSLCFLVIAWQVEF